MNSFDIHQLADALPGANGNIDGVSFKGKSWVLNTDKDCDEVVNAICACKNLQYLNLEGNTLGVEASKAISKALETKKELKRALWMDIFTTRKKEEIPRALEHLGSGLRVAGAQLTELDLSDNALGPIGVKGLAGLLSSETCYQLQVLKLNNNGLGCAGGEMLAQALLACYENSAKQGKSLALRLFVAGRNRLENEGAAQLAKVFEKLGTLEEIVMPQNGIFHKGIKALSDSFKSNPNLKVLDLNDNILTKKGAKHLANVLPHLQKLENLNLQDCLLRSSGATLLANALAGSHQNLEKLNLSFNEIKSDGGLAVVTAMTNKSKLQQLNMDGNMFGSDGRKLLKEGLEKNKKLHTLGTLSEDDSGGEGEGEEEDEDGGGNEDEDGDSSKSVNEDEDGDSSKSVNEDEDGNGDKDEDKEETAAKTNGFNLSGKQANSSGVKPSVQKEQEASDILSSALEDLSVKAKAVGYLKTFLSNPTLENFLLVKEDNISEFINSNQDSSLDFYVETFIPTLVKVSSMASSNNAEAVKLCSKVSANMYKDLFTWACDKSQLPTVNNALFVHLGFIKSEDKSFKINWNVKGSLLALKAAITEGTVPSATKDILECFLNKDTSTQFCKEIIVE